MVHKLEGEGAEANERNDREAILAGGCFWGMQDLIRKRPGVISTRVGYSGGEVPNATYRNHGTHAEAIEIVFDPEQIVPRHPRVLLPDPRPDDDEPPGERRRHELPLGDLLHRRRAAPVAEDTIADVEASGLWPGKVVTEVTRRGRSGRPSPSTRTTSSATRTAHVPLPAPGLGAAASCRRRRALDGPAASLLAALAAGGFRDAGRRVAALDSAGMYDRRGSTSG